MLPVGHGVGQMKIRNILIFNMLSCIMLRMCGAWSVKQGKCRYGKQKAAQLLGMQASISWRPSGQQDTAQKKSTTSAIVSRESSLRKKSAGSIVTI